MYKYGAVFQSHPCAMLICFFKRFRIRINMNIECYFHYDDDDDDDDDVGDDNVNNNHYHHHHHHHFY